MTPFCSADIFYRYGGGGAPGEALLSCQRVHQSPDRQAWQCHRQSRTPAKRLRVSSEPLPLTTPPFPSDPLGSSYRSAALLILPPSGRAAIRSTPLDTGASEGELPSGYALTPDSSLRSILRTSDGGLPGIPGRRNCVFLVLRVIASFSGWLQPAATAPPLSHPRLSWTRVLRQHLDFILPACQFPDSQSTKLGGGFLAEKPGRLDRSPHRSTSVTSTRRRGRSCAGPWRATTRSRPYIRRGRVAPTI